MSFGRITEGDVEKALAHQHETGGFFGESLLALALVTPEELEWGLASQFDLPYIFPDPDSVDPEAAALVSPEWALANLTLPIMRTESVLTVVVDSPIKTEAVDVLEARTDLTIELALSSSTNIRELIRQVYARAAAHEEEERPAPASIKEVFSLALDAASKRFGISTRGPRAWAWYDDRGRIRRRPLEGLWNSELQELISPSPDEEVGDVRRASWSGHVNRDGMVTPIEVQYLADESGAEYLFRPVGRVLSATGPVSSAVCGDPVRDSAPCAVGIGPILGRHGPGGARPRHPPSPAHANARHFMAEHLPHGPR